MKQPPDLGQGDVARHVVPVELGEPLGLSRLLHIGADDAGARQVLLRHRGDAPELRLDRLETLVDLAPEEDGRGRHGQQRQQGE